MLIRNWVLMERCFKAAQPFRKAGSIKFFMLFSDFIRYPHCENLVIYIRIFLILGMSYYSMQQLEPNMPFFRCT